MAESDNILTKLQNLLLYLSPEAQRGPSDAFDGRFKRRSRLFRQYFEISLVALCSQSLSVTKGLVHALRPCLQVTISPAGVL
jgi:hypothetical protein